MKTVQASIIYELNVLKNNKYKTNIALLKYYFNVGKKAKAFNYTHYIRQTLSNYWF